MCLIYKRTADALNANNLLSRLLTNPPTWYPQRPKCSALNAGSSIWPT